MERWSTHIARSGQPVVCLIEGWQVSKPRDSEAKIRQQAGVQGLEIDVVLSENNLLLNGTHDQLSLILSTVNSHSPDARPET
jgi:hypothetical protein